MAKRLIKALPAPRQRVQTRRVSNPQGAAVSARDIASRADYRDFLLDCFELRRASNPKFSYEYCAKRLKTTRGYLSLVLKKKRHISPDRITQLAKLFEFTRFEKQYFIFLVFRALTKDPELIEYFDASLDALRFRQDAVTPAPAESSDLSLTSVYSRMLGCWSVDPRFRGDPAWQQQNLRRALRPGVEPLAKALAEAQHRGFVVRQKDGSFRPGPPNVSESRAGDQERYRSYAEGFELARQAIEQDPAQPNQRIAQLVCALDAAQWAEAERLHREYLGKLMEFLAGVDQSPRAVKVFLHLHGWIPITANEIF